MDKRIATNSTVKEAIKNGDSDAIARAVAEEFDFNKMAEESYHPLSEVNVANPKSVQIARFLIDEKLVDINTLTKTRGATDNHTVLGAIYHNDGKNDKLIPYLQMLFEKGATPPDKEALLKAGIRRGVNVTEFLVKNGHIDPSTKELSGKLAETAMNIAATDSPNTIDGINALIRPEDRKRELYSHALFSAIAGAKEDNIKHLVTKYDADIHARIPIIQFKVSQEKAGGEIEINRLETEKTQTPLMYAARNGYSHSMVELIKLGAKLRAEKSDPDPIQLFREAQQNKQVPVDQIESGVERITNAINERIKMSAVSKGIPDEVLALADKAVLSGQAAEHIPLVAKAQEKSSSLSV